MNNGGGVMRNQGEVTSKTRWEPRSERGRRAERARRSRDLELSMTAAVTALGAVLAAASLAACLPKMHRVPDTERCANGVVSACTPDICATYAPDEVPAGCLDADAGGTETPDAGSTDTSSGPDTATDTGTDTAADTGTDTLTDTGPDTIADTGTDTMTDTGPCDPPTEGCPCSYQGKPDGVCAEALFNGNMVCQEPTGFEVAEVSCDGLDNDCDGITDEGCPCDYQGDPDGVCLAGGAVDGTDGSCSVPSSYEATEASCDGLDNDCDGVADEGCACDYQDNSDGVCATATISATNGACVQPSSYQASESDCDGLDNDCDGVADEGCACDYQGNSDGVCATAVLNASGVCQEPTGFQATETSCDGLDNDCDGVADEGCPCHFQNLDQGVCATSLFSADGVCGAPSGYEANEASCDGLDNDCDGVADEGCPCSYQGKPDGVCAEAVFNASGVCQKPTGFEVAEVSCDGLDNDCDGVMDEGCGCDYGGVADGVCGTATISATDGACSVPTYQATETTCDGLDNDCDGVMDEGCAQGGFVEVPAGTFTMGSPADELGHQDDEVQHGVTLTHNFFLQETEVTQGQWEARMGNNPSQFSSCGADCPVDAVSWWEALAYANAVSAAQGLPACYALEGCQGTAGTGMVCTSVTVNAPGGNPYLCAGYRLPTESEWEYAYRAGTTTAFYNGDITNTGSSDPNLDVIGWYDGNAGNKTHPAAQKAANAWGLYDMAGNVIEWMWDQYGAYATGGVTDPTGAGTGSARVIRGGSVNLSAWIARAAARLNMNPDNRFGGLGFRLARTAP